ncbi:MAG TPA: FtsL-like putative cell division protein [Hymenobacter sp.]|uniref:FtsL-like putative cell division protein n=1 Tax=Hymenobacter sp. TaxID=1898978 RepID=UPI002D81028A|nr:FtsL-like putative cell division protein [Hymenobacter sp.]HET9505332.1 FtsL-like putative cell division protein [Hymenobacter sp.]
MAVNTIRPGAGPAPRANVPRPVVPPAGPENLPVAAVPEPAPAPVAPPPAPAPEKPAAAPRRKPAPEPYDDGQPLSSPGSTWSLFSLLDRFTGLDSLFEEGLPVKYLPKLLFVMLLTLLYIGNTHYGNRMNRNIQRLKLETEDLRADYTTLSSDYMEASKQSEVARKVAAIGLIESSSPPFRIVVPAGHLDGAELETMPVLTADTLAARAVRDSLAAQRADSLRGRIRQQATGAADPAEHEAGPPPPGPAEDVEDEATASSAPVELAARHRAVVPNESPKKSKPVQKKKEGTRITPTKSASAPKNSKKPATHERKR